MKNYFRKNLGWLLLLLLAILPVLKWSLMMPLSFRFADLSTTSTSLGQIAGLVGMTLFSLNLILSSRLKFLDQFFYGLDRVYKYHTRLGAISFALLLFHPLFLVVRYLKISLRSAAMFLLPGSSLAITYGIVALLGMIVLLVITFYLKFKYHYWKLSHKFMVLVFILAILHILFISSDISFDFALRVYIFSLAYLGLVAGFYRAFLSKYWHQDFKYEVKAIQQLNAQVVEIELAPRNKKLDFMPGQFIFIRFFSQSVSSESHPFSLASGSADPNLKIVVKDLGDYTSQLKDIKVGDLALVAGPFGKFSYQSLKSKKQLWLAGGIGITPFLSMVRDFKDQAYDIQLYYCVNKMSEAVLLDELKTIGVNNNIKIIPWCSAEQGKITVAAIVAGQSNLAEVDIMLCGPDAFMTGLRQQFMAAGVKPNRIHWEQFKFL